MMILDALGNIGNRSTGSELYQSAWLVPARAEGGHRRFQPARAAHGGCRHEPAGRGDSKSQQIILPINHHHVCLGRGQVAVGGARQQAPVTVVTSSRLAHARAGPVVGLRLRRPGPYCLRSFFLGRKPEPI